MISIATTLEKKLIKYKGTGDTFEAALKDALTRRRWKGNDKKAFVTDHVIETWYEMRYGFREGEGIPRLKHTVEIADAD